MARTSRNTVKKYINKWDTLGLSYDEFQRKSDTELNLLFCIPEDVTAPNPRRDELEALLPSICKELGKRGMTTLKQWDKYISDHPDGYGLTQFRVAVQRYRMVNNPSMHINSLTRMIPFPLTDITIVTRAAQIRWRQVTQMHIKLAAVLTLQPTTEVVRQSLNDS